jgi:CRP/FNR family transcriptional regulator
MLNPEWVELYPELARLEPAAQATFQQWVSTVQVPAGQLIFGPYDPCQNWLMVLRGSVRVQQTAPSGREIVVCRIGAGKTCIISALCVLSERPYTTESFTEEDLTALALPGHVFRKLLGESDRFRQFVFSAYNDEIMSLMTVVGELAFRRIESRLAERLVEHAGDENKVRRTHQDLAVELGTAREVVSRQLKEFERKGWVRTTRGVIELQDVGALQEIAENRAN